MQSELKKKYGLVTAICMVVGIVIGSGVFFKAQTILEKTNGDMPQGILAWIIGGVIVLACILAFAVMAQRYEKVNGLVDYAEAAVGEKYAYMIGWFASVIYYPTLTSSLGWLSARYTLVFLSSVNPDIAMHISASEGGCVYGPECMLLTALFLIGSFTINAFSPKLAGKLQVSTTVIKLIPLLLMAIVGTIYGIRNTPSAEIDTSILASNFATSSGDFSTLFAAIVATAFAYDGWIIATSINAEIKNAKRNLPIALVGGGIIIMLVYILYYIGVAGGASIDTLIHDGATVAFTNIFGNVFGNILNLFVAISCLGTLNGCALGCSRGMYSIAVRGYGPRPDIFREVDRKTNMPTASAIVGLLLCMVWFVYFYGANLGATNWFGYFGFDSSELPIVTLYSLYIPIFIMFAIKERELPAVKRIILPVFAVIGAAFMTFSAIYAHGIVPFNEAQSDEKFSCPVLFYLIMFAVIMAIGMLFMKKKSTK